ncbi:hypothetical protein [Pseudomonas sp. SGAir0191]|uniref:hypothetical protein n=1 Tax=Pseudomonas sp. SGAir0191 TaxID=2217867 RepID=UPI0015E86445|nr:hypothetical protein [Pseudomonas sp. SGAir0191]
MPKTLPFLNSGLTAVEIRWGKKWGKIVNQRKTDGHKKIQSPLSDWILWSYLVGTE